jgi:hypothetical protein
MAAKDRDIFLHRYLTRTWFMCSSAITAYLLVCLDVHMLGVILLNVCAVGAVPVKQYTSVYWYP